MKQNQDNFQSWLKEFKHHDIEQAHKEHKIALKQKYEVHTINWSYANHNKKDKDYDPNLPSPNYKQVHKNKYVFTLQQLIWFINSLQEIAENVIFIKPLVDEDEQD